MKPGGKNLYLCGICHRGIVTIDRDEGTTPMFLSCRATEGCAGQMTSMMYRLTDDQAALEPTHEWYRPSLRWARRKGPETLDHVQRGGLALREIKR